MNKNIYRVIFNKARGMLMVVGELATSQGKTVSNQSRASLDSCKAADVKMARLKFLSYATSVALGTSVVLVPVARAEIVADQSAALNLRPDVTQAANGIPQVNIQTPNASGLSRNVYSRFDVEQRGAILNNARTTTQTRLGGFVLANPNLIGGTANVILNEVNSANPSQLRGYLEVAGDRAQVIVANPSGITCNGCGFINANRATLTTGQPIISNGNLGGYRVSAGAVQVEGDGLDSTSANFTDIIARAVQINAGLHANDLRVTTGTNVVNAANTTATPFDTDDEKPEFAVDVAALGGMYAGKITLVGTEAGVGVRNAGEIGASAGQLSITTDGRLVNSSQISAAGNTQISTSDDIDNTGTITSSSTISLSSDEDVLNQGVIAASGEISITATELDNTDGTVNGGDTHITVNTLQNKGNARIFADNLTIDATTINNEASGGSAPVIASRKDQKLAVDTLNNSGGALILSEGALSIGGDLDDDGNVIGSANEINNNSSTIEALGNIDINADEINNTNDNFSTEVAQVSRETIQEYALSGSANRYSPSEISIFVDEVQHLVTPTGTDDNFNRFDYTRSISETQVIESTPGQILAGGDLSITSNSLLNDNSRIIAGGDLTVDAVSLTNIETQGSRTTTDSGTLTNFYRIHEKGRDDQGIRTAAYNPAAGIQSISLGTTRFEGNASVTGTGTNIDEVPASSLFITNPDPLAGFLIETDPRFTNLRQFLSSDFVLNQLTFEPTITQKRLGDGFYEQRLIREQLAELTGRRFLDGYADDEAQYRALLTNGLTAVNELELRPGVALSAEQVAQLTSDVVLLIEKEVKLQDGSVEKVLVPQLYVQVREGDINGSGGLLAGETTRINISDSVTNSATIAGRSLLTINADIVNNHGRITAKDAAVSADTDVNNTGGIIDAENSLLVDAGRDLNNTSTTSTQNSAQGSTTSINRLASLFVSSESGTLVASAGRDININAGQVSNEGATGETLLTAGNNLNLGTVEQSSDYAVYWDGSNFRREGTTRETGSVLQVSNNIQLTAGNDLNARGASITSEAGAITASAGNNINLSAADTQRTLDEAHKTVSKGFLSSKTRITRDTVDETIGSGTVISGNTATLNSEGDISISGSQVAATEDVRLTSQKNVSITASTNKTNETHFKSTKTSGLFSSGGLGVTLGTQLQSTDNKNTGKTASGSTVGSTEGNVDVVAGKDFSQTGSTIVAAESDVNIEAQKITINSATNTSVATQETRFKQSGITLSLSSPVISAIQTTQKQVDAAGKTEDARLKVLAAATTALTINNAIDDTKAAIDGKKGLLDGNAGGVSLSISVGSSKSESTRVQKSESAAGSTVAAGNNINITTASHRDVEGGGREGEEHIPEPVERVPGDITIQGSQLSAGNDVNLEASGDIKLLAAVNNASLNSENSSNSASIGFSIGSNTGVTLAASSGRGSEDGNDVVHTTTQVAAGNIARLNSGDDTTLRGAVVDAQQVIANVGGDLSIESLQDSSDFKSKQKSFGFSVTVGPSPGGSINASQSNVDSEFASVIEQSGIKAGDEGFQVDVEGNTDLKGAVIASSDIAAENNKNSLTTGTLTTSDIQNHAEFESDSAGISLGVGSSKGASAGLGEDSGNADSITRAGVSNAEINITDSDEQEFLTGKDAELTIASLNRDVSSDEDGSNAVEQIFDRQQVQDEIDAQVVITQAFGKVAPKAVADFAELQAKSLEVEAERIGGREPERAERLLQEANKFKEGGAYRIALQGVIGALGGGVDGAVGSSIAATTAPILTDLQSKLQSTLIDEGFEPELADLISQGLASITATGVGSIVSGNYGAAASLNVDANNRQLHPDEVKFLQVDKRVRRYAEYIKKETGRVLTYDESRRELSRFATGLVDYEAKKIFGSSELFNSFIRNEASKYSLLYTAKNGELRSGFSLKGDEFNNEFVNLKPLFSEIGTEDSINQYIKDIAYGRDRAKARERYNIGSDLGYLAAAEEANILDDYIKIIGGIAETPVTVIEASLDDEVGPYDSKQIAEYYKNLLLLQGRYEEAGFFVTKDFATSQRLVILGLPLAEIPLGAIANKLPKSSKQANLDSGTNTVSNSLSGETKQANIATGSVDEAVLAAETTSTVRAGGVVTKGIKTPYGVANQATDAASLAARGQVENGATLYRIGTTGKSQTAEAQFWSFENPLSKGFSQRYGIPEANIKNANFIETATLKPGASFITRPAPGVGVNKGGGIEVVVPSSGVQMRAFNFGGHK